MSSIAWVRELRFTRSMLTKASAPVKVTAQARTGRGFYLNRNLDFYRYAHGHAPRMVLRGFGEGALGFAAREDAIDKIRESLAGGELGDDPQPIVEGELLRCICSFHWLYCCSCCNDLTIG